MALPLRGELWWCEPPEIGRRPVVILSRDAAIPRLRRTLIAPCTTTIRGLASEVILEPGEDPVFRKTAVNLDSVESVSVGVLIDRIGRLSDSRMGGNLRRPGSRSRLPLVTLSFLPFRACNEHKFKSGAIGRITDFFDDEAVGNHGVFYFRSGTKSQG